MSMLGNYFKSFFSKTTKSPTYEIDDDEEVSVPWMETAESLMGTREIKGRRSNSTIMSWAKNLGSFIKSVYKNDDTPWCGLFINHILAVNDVKVNLKNPLGARNWLKFGKKIEPCYGAIMVFYRGKKSGWTGHVGVAVSQDKYYYHILGGNQSDSVNVTKISKKRFLGARWPSNYPALHKIVKKEIGLPYKKFDGKASINEA
jgi:uncharacterized protein (TIGR02594 family)